MAALAICAVTAALLKDRTDTQAPPPVSADQPPPAEPGMIPLTIPQIKRLLAALTTRPLPRWLASTGTHGPAATRPAHDGSTNAPGSPAAPRLPWSASEMAAAVLAARQGPQAPAAPEPGELPIGLAWAGREGSRPVVPAVGQAVWSAQQPGPRVRRPHGVTRYACAAVLPALTVLAGCATAATMAPPRQPAQTAAAASAAAGQHSPPSAASATSTPASRAAAKLSQVDSVSCADARHCWAGAEAGTKANDGVILASVNGGAAWTVQKTIPGVDAVGPIDCPSTTHCLAVGNRVVSLAPPLLVSTTNAGKTWAEHALPESLSELQALDCVNDEDCWGVGIRFPVDGDVVMATTNFGR